MKKPLNLALVAASALAALAIGLGAQAEADREPGSPAYAARSLPDLR